ncbi:hypothetical protein [Microvirga brassicacearum]|uniref:Uncharacterized protein n=1 Tax=Microvirga brassicacearum TaxID=2580413 RepID=A0A5N3PAF6_9HYPH|nr:hypothetical protein [Microvirga brassicacearum]KAB0266595.1 hypothetical protein FEZ63_13230 [Microvirga brassicacearum]
MVAPAPMPLPWRQSREADLWLRVDPAKAVRGFAQTYSEQAGEEALLRALLAERDGRREAAGFWLRVYEGWQQREKAAAV